MDTIPNHNSLFEEELYFESLGEKYIYSPIYATYDRFGQLEKPTNYKAFFITRDPRDLVVSWYFSAGWSHSIVENQVLAKVRSDLQGLSQNEGLHYSIDYLADYGIFNAIDSWLEALPRQEDIRCIRYEDLTGANQFLHFRELMDYLMIPIPDKTLRVVLADHSFKTSAGETQLGNESLGHNRKGKAGDWVNYLNQKHLERLAPHVTQRMSKIGYGIP